MKLYKFTPNEDLTILELAELFKIMTVALVQIMQGNKATGDEDLEIDTNIYDTLPDNLKKYFVSNEPDDLDK